MLCPKVRLKGIEEPEPKLLWHKVKRGDLDGGELLAECELFLVRNLKLFGVALTSDVKQKIGKRQQIAKAKATVA